MGNRGSDKNGQRYTLKPNDDQVGQLHRNLGSQDAGHQRGEENDGGDRHHADNELDHHVIAACHCGGGQEHLRNTHGRALTGLDRLRQLHYPRERIKQVANPLEDGRKARKQ